MNYLKSFIEKYRLPDFIFKELKSVNETLWTIEDDIRIKEKNSQFDDTFIQLARNVYITNDKRCEVKNNINKYFDSDIMEVKSYENYILPEKTTNKKKKNNNKKNKNKIDNIYSNKLSEIHVLIKEYDENYLSKNYHNVIQIAKKIIQLSKNTVKTSPYYTAMQEIYLKYLRELGDLYKIQQSFNEAIECYENIIHVENNISSIGVLYNEIGICYHLSKRYEKAIEYFKKVININNKIPDVYNNIGVCYVSLKKYKLAEINYLLSYNLNQNDNAISSLGDIYYYTKQYDKSLDFYTKIKAPIDRWLYNMSFSYLAKKYFKKGFQLYESRLNEKKINSQTNQIDRVEIPSLKYWDGKTNCNKLLVVSEQGLGDNIQYYRFIIELSKKYPKMNISFFSKKELSHIFKTYENIEIVHELFVFHYDYKLFIMSLPKILELDSIQPNEINYIRTNPTLSEYWREKIHNESITNINYKKNGLNIGIVYNGLLISFIDKYIPLSCFESLTELNVNLFIIHRKKEIEYDLNNNAHFRNKFISYDIDNDKPFEDTIHLIQHMDLLITIDTYIVHLAGIMNIKTWLLLGVSEWRWSDDEYKTYWYNSVELIRTKNEEELSDLMIVVKEKLKKLLDERT
jgi:tetratricopeptide (TPR) repeat protein